MRFRLCAAALGLSLLVFGLTGCGGGSGNAVNNPLDFQGTYVGSFGGTLNGSTVTGTLSEKIAADGTLTGTAHDNTANTDASVTGSVTTAGAFTSTFVYPSSTITVSGTVGKDSRRHLVGTLTEFSGPTVVGTISIDLTRE